MDKKTAPAAQDIRPEFETVYHWNRIIPAVASLAIGVGAVLWLWPEATPKNAPQQAATAPVETKKDATTPAPNESVLVDLPLHLKKPESLVSSAAKTGSEKPSVATSAQPSSTETAAAQNTLLSKPAAEANAPQSANTVALEAINEAPAPSAGIKAGQVKISSKYVKQASLSQVLDQDPLEIPKGTISLSKKKAVKVVFSADVAKANEQVNYIWYHDGKLQAKVATRTSPEAKAKSSKYISYDAPGQWQVQMTDVHGKVLAESAFSAKRN